MSIIWELGDEGLGVGSWEERESVCGDGGVWGFIVGVCSNWWWEWDYFPQNREIQPFQPE